MLTFKRVLEAFQSYLEEDTRYEVMLTSHSYIILGWNSSNDDLESAVFCPTPEDMKEILPNDLTGYLEYKRTLGCRDLTDAERAAIHTQVEEMADSIELHSGGQRARRTDAEPQP